MSQSTERESTPIGFSTSPADLLKDAEVENFFLGLLESQLPARDTYDKFVQFFTLRAAMSAQLTQRAGELQGGDRDQADRVLAAAGIEAGVWQPQKIQKDTSETLARALRRLLASQHRDGGWGYKPEESSTWATVYAARSLHRAHELRFEEPGAVAASRRGIDWLLRHQSEWSVEHVPDAGARTIYELSAVLRCLIQTGSDSSPTVRRLVALCMQRLAEAQNDDGGWDSSVWGDACPEPTRVWSEVGATSCAVRALADARDPELRGKIVRGLEALSGSQNEDGSWSVMLHYPESPDPPAGDLGKTCDAIKGLQAGKRVGADMAVYERRIDQAVKWLERSEKPFFTEIAGWGWAGSWAWDGRKLSALENTCLTLETLLAADRVLLPLLTSNASWLMRSQHRQAGSVEDGKWVNNDTGRITLSLLEFYRVIKDSPLFSPLAADEER